MRRSRVLVDEREQMRRPSGLGPGRWASAGTASEKVLDELRWTRSMNSGLRSITSASNTVAAHSGSRPDERADLEPDRLPSGIRITS